MNELTFAAISAGTMAYCWKVALEFSNHPWNKLRKISRLAESIGELPRTRCLHPIALRKARHVGANLFDYTGTI